MKIRDYRQQFVYHSPQYPGFTSWCGLYKLPDDGLMCTFTQATGKFQGRPKAPEEIRLKLDYPYEGGVVTPNEYAEASDMTGLTLENVHLLSKDFGDTWKYVGGDVFRSPMNGVAGQCELALADGSLLRGVQSEYLVYDDVPQIGYTQRSFDNGKTWDEPNVIYPVDNHMVCPKRMRKLRDGRLMIGGALIRSRPENTLRRQWFTGGTVAFFVSEDEGKTWGEPIHIVPAGQNAQELGLTEELDWVELPNGDLLVIIRADNRPEVKRRMQTRMVASGKTWTPTHIDVAPFPHSGHPEMLMTREGIALHLSTDAIWWTDDEGENWRTAEVDDKPLMDVTPVWYYPRSVQMSNGEIIVVGHVGSDDGYGARDQSIVASRFFIER